MTLLSATDATNLAVEASDTPMHVGVIATLDGPVRLADLRDHVAGRLDVVPELRRRLARAGPFAAARWVQDPDFQIDRHVREVSLAAPADEAALLRLADDLLTPLLDRARPLWRMWLVTGLPAGRTALVVALHHAVADGIAAIGCCRGSSTPKLRAPRLCPGPPREPRVPAGSCQRGGRSAGPGARHVRR